jgi:hypothetical protein
VHVVGSKAGRAEGVGTIDRSGFRIYDLRHVSR